MDFRSQTVSQLESLLLLTQELAVGAKLSGRTRVMDALYERAALIEAELELRDHRERSIYYGWRR